MKRIKWFGTLSTVLALVSAIGWYRERQRAEDAIMQRETVVQELAALNQTLSNTVSSGQEPEAAMAKVDDGSPQPGEPIESVRPMEKLVETVTAHPQETNEKPPSVTADTNKSPVQAALNIAIAPQLEPSSYTDLQLDIYRCNNQMREICIATDRWAADHKGLIPRKLTELRDYIAPMLLVCPGVRPHFLTTGWRKLDENDITYEIRPGTAGARWDFQWGQTSPTTIIWLACPVHGILADNMVSDPGVPRPMNFIRLLAVDSHAASQKELAMF